MMSNKGKIYEFGGFRLDAGERTLIQNGQPVMLTPKVFDLLAILVGNHGHLMTKDELIRGLWQDSFVEEANLNVNISTLRRALGETPTEQRFIETVPRAGYRFVAEVREVSDGSQPEPKADVPHAIVGRAGSGNRRVLIAALVVLIGAGLVVAWKIFFTGSATDVSQLRTIAVLPFRPLAGAQTDVALQMGMADALITRLSSLQQLTVRPTSAIERYTEATDPIAAGRELQVEAVLDGKIQRAENRVRVTVQLLRVSDGATLWAGSFDDFFTNIFAVQDSISEKMTASLRVKLSGTEQQQLVKRFTESTEAYELYLQGNYFRRRGIPDDLKQSVEFYRRSIDKDPQYVLPYAAIAMASADLNNFQVDPDRNAELARSMAARALELDPKAAEANAAVAAVKFGIDLKIDEADEYLRRAIEINPGNADALHEHADLLSIFGKKDESLKTILEARQVDPFSIEINTTYVDLLSDAHRYDDALNEAQRLVAGNPRSVHYRRTLARVYALKGMYDEAIEQHLEDVELGGMRRAAAALGYIYAKSGNANEARKILDDRIAHVGEPTVPYYGIALIYLGLGDNDKAFEWLDKSYRAHEPLVFLVKKIPEWDPVRSDPRYSELMQRIGVSP